MNNPTMRCFPEQDIIHLAITDEAEIQSLELSPNITAELNADGDLIGVEILKASTFLRDFILESTQAKLMQFKQSAAGRNNPA
jgi:uncharacterized protein YuzE